MILPSKHIRNVRFQAVGTWTCMTEIGAKPPTAEAPQKDC